MTALAASAIATSAFLAFIVNMSTFMIIGKMSAITYNVAGHAKLCFVLASGYLLFDSKFSWLNMGGVGIAISGVVAYSVIKMMPAKATDSPVQPVVKSADEHVSIPFNPINVNDSETESGEQRRSLLIINNESIFTSTKIAPVPTTTKEVNIDSIEIEAKQDQLLIK